MLANSLDTDVKDYRQSFSAVHNVMDELYCLHLWLAGGTRANSPSGRFNLQIDCCVYT